MRCQGSYSRRRDVSTRRKYPAKSATWRSVAIDGPAYGRHLLRRIPGAPVSHPSPASPATSNLPPLYAALIAVATVASASIIGSLATTPNIPTWYAGLTKPSFNPPNWIFGPVWTALYAMMAIAFFRILRRPASPARRSAIIAFVGQMALNALWSVVFFELKSPPLGFLVVASLWALIALTARRFAGLDRVAGMLMAPYLAWVSFAALLNAAIWRLN